MQQKTQKDIYSSFHVFYLILRCLGILPFTSTNTRQNTFQIKCEYFGVFILVSLTTLQPFIFSYCRNRFPYLLSDFMVGVDVTFMVALLLIYLKLAGRKIMNLLSKIDAFDKNVKFRYFSRNELRKYFFLNCFHFSLMLSVDLTYRTHISSKMPDLCMLSKYVSSSLILFTRLLFVFFVKAIKIRFEYLGEVTDPKLLPSGIADLVEICQKVNALYNFPLIRNFGKLFVWLTLDMVYLVLVEDRLLEKMFVVVVSCCWGVLNFSEILLIVQPLEDLYSKVRVVGCGKRGGFRLVRWTKK